MVKVKVALNLESDLAAFMRKTGEAKKTDLAAGRFNWSQILGDYARQFIAGQEPIVIATSYKAQRDAIAEELHRLEEKARQDLGTTIDDFFATHPSSIAQVAEAKIRATHRASTLLEKIRFAFGEYKGSRAEAWISSRFREELKVLGVTSHELVEMLERGRA